MKTTKKVLAASLAVMMVAATVPFAASAAGETGKIQVTLSPYAVDEAGTVANVAGNADGNYEMSLYKVATFDLESGKYTAVAPFTDASITNKINEFKATPADQKTKSQELVNLLNGVTIGGSYTPADTLTFTISSADESTKTATATTIDLSLGIYYSRFTSKPGSVTKVTNSLFVLTLNSKTETATINKIVTDEVVVEKDKDTDYVGYDKDVAYTLRASTVGSTSEKVNTYAIVDTMDDGLDFQKDVTVYGVNVAENGTETDTEISDTYYDVKEPYTYKDASGGNQEATFAVVLTPEYLATDAFYGFDKIKVTFTAKVNANAVVNETETNTDGLVYGNTGNVTYKPGETVEVKPLGVKLVKYDGSTVAPGFTYLAGATFGLYTKNEADELVEVKLNGTAVTATTTDTGAGVTFKAGETEYLFGDTTANKYFVKEINPPTGYNLNSTVYGVTLTTDGTAYTFVGDTVTGADNKMVPNYAVTVPATGGTGTMVFTIVGASLIVCAGVLLFVLKRKNAAK